MENCTKFGQLILSKIVKIVATIICQISRPKCTKFDFGWGSAPDPAGGAYSALPDPLAWLRGPTSRGREAGEREGMGNGGRKRGERGRVSWICLWNIWSAYSVLKLYYDIHNIITGVPAGGLKLIRWDIGSQCNDFSSGFAWQNFRCCNTTRARQFCTFCSFDVVEFGVP